MTFLTDAERAQLRAQHKRERDKRICDRIKAVILCDKGWAFKEIAEALLLSEDAIREHVNEYNNSQKLQPNGGGSMEKLSIEQSLQMEAHLQKHTYLYVKDIVAYVKSTLQVTYTVAGMRHWLRRHGFSYKKPALVPGKANKKEQEAWIEEYKKLKQGLGENETICFIDGVHPTHNVQLAYGWIKKGIRKEIASNSGRFRLNLSGIVDMVSHKILIQEDDTLNAEATIRFFRKIEEAYPTKTKIYLFCDNAKYYQNRAVKEYLKSSAIDLKHLPPYSPNLNPIERLWKWMKERILYNTYYENFADFKSAVLGFFALLSRVDLTSVLGQCFQRRVRDRFRSIGAPVPDF